VVNPGRSTGKVRLLPDVSLRVRGLHTGEVPAVGPDFAPLPGWEETTA
jgi:hypothetical protein